jgi:hypothetical protein
MRPAGSSVNFAAVADAHNLNTHSFVLDVGEPMRASPVLRGSRSIATRWRKNLTMRRVW